MGEIFSAIVGVIVGFLASFAVFRARFTAIEKDIQYIKEDNTKEWTRLRNEFKDLCDGDGRYWNEASRAARVQVEILASIARKLGVSHRITDVSSYVDQQDDKG